MSYALRAFIGKTALAESLATQVAGAHVVTLPHGYSLVPLTDSLAEWFESDGFVKPFWLLPTKLFSLAAEFSANSQLGYFEIDMVGGVGHRNAVLWQNHHVVFGPASSAGTAATEQLFALLGVPKTWQHDRFEVLNLGRHRDIEDWLDET